MTRSRAVVAIAVSMLLGSALAGCTPLAEAPSSPPTSSALPAGPTPAAGSAAPSTVNTVPAPLASATCTPATASVVWGTTQRTDGKTVVPDAPVGVYVSRYESGAAMTGARHTIPALIDFASPALDALTDADPAARDRWHAALITDAGRQPGLDDSVGTPVQMPDMSPVAIDKAKRGTYVVEVAVNQLRKAYVITCSDGRVMKGRLTAPLAGGFASTVVRCGIHPTDPTAAQKVALAYCPGA